MTACVDVPPPIVSADTSCLKFKHISLDDAQRAAVSANLGLWKTAAQQIREHNMQFDKDCSDPPSPAEKQQGGKTV